MPSPMLEALCLLLLIRVTPAQLNLPRHPLNSLHLDALRTVNSHAASGPTLSRRQENSTFLNENTESFAIDGSALPEVNFDVGESYAGLLPIGEDDDPNQLFFWFFPSTNPSAENEIVIWLTGGPGCSSVGELMQENGPFLWQPGVFRPIPNKWSWHHLTNVVWIDQPVGSGFSQGTPTARNEPDVAAQFLGFWRRFGDLFGMQGYKTYVTGASYSGLFGPYIANELLAAEDPSPFNISGMMVFNALYSKDTLSQEITAATSVENWPAAFPFNDSFRETIQTTADECGYAQYLEEYLVFPPSGPQPARLPGFTEEGEPRPDCGLMNNVLAAATEINACFNPYAILENCPRPFDPLGFSGSTMYIPPNFGPAYFDREDVKAAINAPADAKWEFCSSDPVFVDGVDESLDSAPGSLPVLPQVIEATGNVIIGHGKQDFVVQTEGTLLAIQNLTWGGKMGFQEEPRNPLLIPFHENEDITNVAGAGTVGVWHQERGLTYFNVEGAGHFLSMDLPAVAYRALEVLLGRAENLGSDAPFTTEANVTQQVVVGSETQSDAESASRGGDGSAEESTSPGLRPVASLPAIVLSVAAISLAR